MEVSDQLHAPVVLPPVHIGYEVVWAPKQSGCGDEEKKSNYWPCRDLNPGRSAQSLDSIMTEPSRLKYERLLVFMTFVLNNFQSPDNP
jgi:hypothetical protein